MGREPGAVTTSQAFDPRNSRLALEWHVPKVPRPHYKTDRQQ